MREGIESLGVRIEEGRIRMSRKEKAERIVEMYEAGYSYKEICEALRVAPKTIAKVLREAESGDKFSEFEGRLRDLEGRLSKLEEEGVKRGEINERLSNLEDYLRDLEVRVERLEKRLEEGGSRVLKLEKDLKKTGQRLEVVRDKLKEVIRAVNNLYY